jgi:hypothetical protein
MGSEETDKNPMPTIDVDTLQLDLQESLRKQGFVVHSDKSLEIVAKEKDDLRNIQLASKQEKLIEAKKFIKKKAELVKKYSIDGKNINPKKIELEIKHVLSSSTDEMIFKWWNLVWWSMPYQRPFGRQMRFIIWDRTHDAPFGLISLQSPILKQAVRDKALGIPRDSLDYWINRSMYAQRVGALPPYSELLGGKMTALTLVSNEIKHFYKEKYLNKTTIMEKRKIESELLFITTTSAFGRSSLYNRLKYQDDIVAEKIGYTEGYGSFQISNSLYIRLLEYLESIGENIKRGYGNGPSRKLKLIRLACRKLNVANYSFHGIKRECYLFSFISNLRQVISTQEQPIAKDYAFNDLFDYWKTRWMEKRIKTTNAWRNFDMNNFVKDTLNTLEGGTTNEKRPTFW